MFGGSHARLLLPFFLVVLACAGPASNAADAKDREAFAGTLATSNSAWKWDMQPRGRVLAATKKGWVTVEYAIDVPASVQRVLKCVL